MWLGCPCACKPGPTGCKAETEGGREGAMDLHFTLALGPTNVRRGQAYIYKNIYMLRTVDSHSLKVRIF